MLKNIAVVFVGLPGVGKTAVAKELLKVIPNSIYIEIDSFRKSGTPCPGTQYDNNSFLQEIDKNIKLSNLIICKNHHTIKCLEETLDVLKRNNSKYFVFNFVPENFEKMEREQQNNIIDSLLDRIEKRTDKSSPLEINAIKSREQAKRTIIYGFVKKYEPPSNYGFSNIYLDFNASIMENVKIIYQKVISIPDYKNNKKRKFNLI